MGNWWADGVLKKQLLLLRWKMRRLGRADLIRWLLRQTRPASYPYLSGDGFRRLANHVYDETSRSLAPQRVRRGDIIFLNTDRVAEYFGGIGAQITAPYVLITHNSDLAVDELLTSMARSNVQWWFAQNNVHQDDRVVPIPIGLENLHHYRAGIPRNYTEARSRHWAKKPRVLVAFDIGTNRSERQAAYESAASTPSADRLVTRLTVQEYLPILAEYEFVLSPPGNGIDTHRTWEAMYLGVVPIVKDSVAMRYFEALGLPLWVVQDWDELRSLREEDLAGKYEKLRAGFSHPALFMDYWHRRIQESALGGPGTAQHLAHVSP